MPERSWSEELKGLFRANIALINLITYEEERVIRKIEELTPGLALYSWDLADGLRSIREARPPMPRKELTSDTLLPFLAEQAPQNCVAVLRDFHHAWKKRPDFITRKLRNMAPGLRAKNQFLVILTPFADLPAELKDDVLVMEVPLPDREELARLLDEASSKLDRRQQARPEVREKLIGSALGLTSNQARLAFSRAYARFECFDERAIELVTWFKRQVIRESGALEFWPAEEGEADVGGLDLLKGWLALQEKAFLSEEARRRKLPYPRGVALIGIPGTGKSLTAKMTAGMWKLPLLRLDVGAVFGSLLGESEQNMRRAIQLAETVSPCILWVDELEKAFAGVAARDTSSGAATRVFGTFLTWMQEGRSPVYVMATANEVAALPVELLARFDRTFFLDLPNAVERRQIFLIHLRRAGVVFPERQLRLDELVQASRGFVGREIERVVRQAHFAAFADGNREIEQADLEKALSEVIPISKSHAGVIEELRRWKREGLASPASREEPEPAPVGRFGAVEVP